MRDIQEVKSVCLDVPTNSRVCIYLVAVVGILRTLQFLSSLCLGASGFAHLTDFLRNSLSTASSTRHYLLVHKWPSNCYDNLKTVR